MVVLGGNEPHRPILVRLLSVALNRFPLSDPRFCCELFRPEAGIGREKIASSMKAGFPVLCLTRDFRVSSGDIPTSIAVSRSIRRLPEEGKIAFSPLSISRRF